MTDIHLLSALETAAAVRRRELSPVQVVEHSLERAQRLGPALGAFITLTPDLALEQARAAERAVLATADPGDLPPLLGVPCPVKDLVRVPGVRWTLGSAAFADQVADLEDGVVTLLRRAGTVLTGTTNTPEFGLPCYTEPDVAPPARTPWDPARSAGGSSGGAAVAVAAGIVPVAHGSDGGGSIRIPASACGLVGLKPTRGRVSPGPHGVDVAGLGVDGVLTRTVRDTAALLDVLARPWPGDLHRLRGPATTFAAACDRDPGQLRIGLLAEPVIDAGAPVAPECHDALVAAGRLLEGLGHVVEPAPRPFPPERWTAFQASWGVLARLVPVPPDREPLLRPLTRWLREQGSAVSGEAYALAAAAMQLATREAETAWAAYDLIACPTLAQLPVPVGALRDDRDPAGDFAAQVRFTPWTSVWNITGGPAVSLPLHRAQVGGTVLPVGVMLGARAGAEETLLAVAAQLERAAAWVPALDRLILGQTVRP